MNDETLVLEVDAYRGFRVVFTDSWGNRKEGMWQATLQVALWGAALDSSRTIYVPLKMNP